MNTQLEIKNFRVFGSDGATIELKPITILTGCNSSGKSSIVKSLLFLKEFFRKATDDLIRTGKYRPAQYSVEFTLPELNLQSFKSAVNKNHPEKPIVLVFNTESLLFKFKVELSFVYKETDPFDRAWLQSMSIYSLTEELLLKAEVDRDVLRLKSLNLLNEEFYCGFFNAAYIANYLFIQRKKSECIEWGDVIDPESYEMWEQEEITYLDFLSKITVPKSVFDDIVKEFVYEGFVSDFPSLSGQRDNYLVGIKKTLKHNLIFYFPVLDHLMDLDKDEVINKLSDIKFNDSLPLSFSVNNWGKIIADSFEKSRHENFIDFYRELENKELSDVMATVNNIFANLNRQEDFFEEVNSYASIRFDSNNNIHIFSTENNEVDFNKVYRFLSCWQWSEGLSEGNGIISGVIDSNCIQSSHILYDAMIEYLSFMLKKVLFPNFFNRLEYVGNFQSNVKRLYSFDDKSNNLGNTIYSFLELKSKLNSIHKAEASWNTHTNIYTPGSFMNKWVKKLGIGTKVIIKEDVDGLGAKLYIKKKGERNDSPLADEGYGISQIITFLLHIENEILKNKLKEDRVQIGDTYLDGTPVDETNEIPTLAIEEPEVSLHPSMQSMLTDVFFDASKNYGIDFIVETHSEYLIRRSQAIIANMHSKEEFEARPFAVHYVERGGRTYELVYQESGRFENSFGPGFFDEAGRSSIQVLKREKKMKHEKNV